MLSLWEGWAFEERLSDKETGSTYIKKCVKPAPCSQEMSCNLVGTGHAYEQVGGAALAT